jgi:hypothetical protein
MATSTGKAARKRWGTRFAAKASGAGAASGGKRPRQRRTWGKLTYSVAAGNVPQGAVNANDALVERIFNERRRNGWDDDANVAVPGPTRASRPKVIFQEEAN